MTQNEAAVARLRSLMYQVHAGHLGEASEAEFNSLLDHAAALFDTANPRLRWYEQGADGHRARHRDLSPWSGALNPVAPPLVIEPVSIEPVSIEPSERAGAPTLVGRVRLDRLREGPPGSAHGGVLAGLFDEIMGAGQHLTGHVGGMTGRLTVRYRQPTPIDTDLIFRTWITDERSIRIVLSAECLLADTIDHEEPVVTAQAEGIFVRRRSP